MENTMISYNAVGSAQTRTHLAGSKSVLALEAATTSRLVRQAVLELMGTAPDNVPVWSLLSSGESNTGGQHCQSASRKFDLRDKKDVCEDHNVYMDSADQYRQLISDTLGELSNETNSSSKHSSVQMNATEEIKAVYQEMKNAWSRLSKQRLEFLEIYASVSSQAQDKIVSWCESLLSAWTSPLLSRESLSFRSVLQHLQYTKLQAITTELDLLYLQSLSAKHPPESVGETPSMESLSLLSAELPAVVKHSTHMRFSVPYEAQYMDLERARSARIMSGCEAIEDVVTKLFSAEALQIDLAEYDYTLSRLLEDAWETDTYLKSPRFPDQIDIEHSSRPRVEQTRQRSFIQHGSEVDASSNSIESM